MFVLECTRSSSSLLNLYVDLNSLSAITCFKIDAWSCIVCFVVGWSCLLSRFSCFSWPHDLTKKNARPYWWHFVCFAMLDWGELVSRQGKLGFSHVSTSHSSHTLALLFSFGGKVGQSCTHSSHVNAPRQRKHWQLPYTPDYVCGVSRHAHDCLILYVRCLKAVSSDVITWMGLHTSVLYIPKHFHPTPSAEAFCPKHAKDFLIVG